MAEDWKRAEAPLIALDSVLSLFSRNYKLRLTKNVKHWPGRSFHWKGANSIDCFLQLSVINLVSLKLNLGIYAYRDFDGSRLCKTENLRTEETYQNLQSDLPELLVEAKNKLDFWCTRPEELEFAVELSSQQRKL